MKRALIFFWLNAGVKLSNTSFAISGSDTAAGMKSVSLPFSLKSSIWLISRCIFSAFFCTAFSSLERMASASEDIIFPTKPRIMLRGLLNSWETFSINSVFIFTVFRASSLSICSIWSWCRILMKYIIQKIMPAKARAYSTNASVVAYHSGLTFTYMAALSGSGTPSGAKVHTSNL